MGLDSRPAQIVALTVIVGAIMGFLWLTGVWGQSQVVDQPIVSDEPVAKTDTLRIVGKDEIQRLLNDEALKRQKLENRVTDLELQVEDLKALIEGG